tara:strand:- start:150 stop:383 length:234 start_codon:yes stop_codon:yes gene_type:complete
MSNKQTTAVEWLFDKLNNSKCWADPIQCSELFEEAKAIERKQIEDAFNTKRSFDFSSDASKAFKTAEQYFTSTFTEE